MNVKTNKQNGRVAVQLVFLSGLSYCIALFVLLKCDLVNNNLMWLICLASGAFIAGMSHRTVESAGEFMYIGITWIIFNAIGLTDPVSYFLPLAAAVLIMASYPAGARIHTLLTWGFIGAWYYFGEKTPVSGMDPAEYIAMALTIIMLAVYTISVFRIKRVPPKKIDLILCSYSGNTAHYANAFIDGAKQAGADVSEHRFHYWKDFAPELSGDSLVVAFPIFGLKIPSSLLSYMLFRLPGGNGKPAFILSTAIIGGPENGGVLAWLILTLKGYRVSGRNWALYPLNVPAFRLGPKKLWDLIDSGLPLKSAIKNQIETGKAFANGIPSGMPVILWPSPFTLIGALIENRLVNRIYRSHVDRKRCNGCGTCIRFCPSERISMVNSYPKSKGICLLCMGCINNCPMSAMHLRFFIEFGNVYKSKWKELIVTSKASMGADRKDQAGMK